MEESSEAHMETDVSSTTEDVPEIQEVTGSHGNMEMVIVVEKLEEDMDSSMPDDIDTSKFEENVNDLSATIDISPKKVLISQMLLSKSPIIVSEAENLPSKLSKPLKIGDNDDQLNEVQPSIQIQQVEMADSSSKESQSIEDTEEKISKEAQLPVQKSIHVDSNIKLIQKFPTETMQDFEANSTESSIKKLQDSITNPIQDSPKTSQESMTNSEQKSPKALIESMISPIKNSPKDLKELMTNSVQKSAKDLQECVRNPLHKSTKDLGESMTIPKQKCLKDLQESMINPILKSTTIDAQVCKIIPTTKSPIKEVTSQELTNKISSSLKEFTMAESSVINGKIQNNDTNNEDDTQATILPIDITVEKEVLKDSQTEINTELQTEKDHNKSISRELKSLINSAKESKIISECTQLTSKTRKSRTALDTSNTSLNNSVEADKIQGNRRSSSNSQKSNCSEKSEKVLKRSMRSQNPEFVSKVKQFLNSVTGKSHKDSDEEHEDKEDKSNKYKSYKGKKDYEDSGLSAPASKVRKIVDNHDDNTEENQKLRSDPYCWRCHWVVEQAVSDKAVHTPMSCTVCPRTFHYKCLSSIERNKIDTEKSWVCPECMTVLQAESSETRSPAMKKISLGMLCDLLKYALQRMMELNGVEPFMQPVDRSVFPDYDKYVVHPMDLSLMKSNIAQGLYGSTEAFLGDAQWILHNSIIFNTLQAKLTAAARALVRSCRTETGEIEACPECYAGAHARRPTWFTDVCTTPHILLWAKLKGFPYWPAKGMTISAAGHVDVRFFGAHDRAWVPAKDCYLYSEKDPNNFRSKRQDLLDSMQEAEQHIRNISRKYGKFVYPPFKTQLDILKLNEQLKMMIPSFEGEVKPLSKDKVSTASPTTKKKRRSNSKSSKSSVFDGDISDSEESSSRKMADGTEIAWEEDDSITPDKNITETPQSKENELSRKRRHSELEEAVITIIETSNSLIGKRNRIEEDKTKGKRRESQEPASSKEGMLIMPKEKPKDVEMTSNTTVNTDDAILKDNEPSSSTSFIENEKKEERNSTLRVTPIRIAIVQKDKKNNDKSNSSKETTAKIITPSKNITKTTPNKDKVKVSILKDGPKYIFQKELKSMQHNQKQTKPEKTSNAALKDGNSKTEKRRNSKNNKSMNNSSTSKDKTCDIVKEKNVDNNSNKDKHIENNVNKQTEKVTEKQLSSQKPNTDSSKSVKDHFKLDDDAVLTIITQGSSNAIVNNNVMGLPTISSVRSLSTITQYNNADKAKSTLGDKTVEITIEPSSSSSIFTPTSTDSVTNMKDAVTKLQKIRSDAEPVVGRVGVRAFARMTSPDKQKKNDDVQVEIKAEPIDLDEPERHMEKMDLMNAFRLRPVNPAGTSLRDVRINKLVVAPLNVRNPMQPADVRPRARKSFPQSKMPEDSRSELNGKNSMVYIPVQPSTTQAPIRSVRAVPSIPVRPPVPLNTSTATQGMQVPTLVSSSATTTTPTVSSTPVQTGPTVGPTTVHTVPLMTSVNGQWMFSFQPIMSVGAIDRTASPPLVNGVGERGAQSVPTLTPTKVGVNTTTTVGQATVPGEPPRLQQRPPMLLLNPLDPNSPVGNLPTPSTAGPLTTKLNQNAVKLADFFRTLLEDSLEKVDDPSAQLMTLKLALEQSAWKHKQEISEIKHNHELTLAEMRASFEKEKANAVNEARRTAQAELEAAVKQAKTKQWCANCAQEAQFYCCWNTSYCDYPCQRAHWAHHFSVCTQQRAQDGNSANGKGLNSPEHRLQPQPENLPKNLPAPALTVGGKLAPSRVFTQDPHSPQRASIIVSMIQDSNGNKSMKCVGTYKPPASAQSPPTILNQQLLNNEESSNKKVVSSGGYLIVGAPNSAAVVTPARRTHTIQYFT